MKKHNKLAITRLICVYLAIVGPLLTLKLCNIMGLEWLTLGIILFLATMLLLNIGQDLL